MDLFKWFRRKSARTRYAAMNMASGSAVWSDRNYENFTKESYMKNVVAFACIDKIAKAVSMVPWAISSVKKDGEKERLHDHYFSSLLNRANSDESWMMFLYGTVSYLCMSGNAFVERVSPDTGPNRGLAKELWALRPDRMGFELDNQGYRSAYIYKVNSTEIRYPVDPVTGVSDVMQIKMFHPLNDNWGMSPIEPAARKIDSSNSMDDWNKKLIDNTGRPGMLLFFKEALSDKQYERLKKSIRADMEGSSNAGKTHLLEGATDAKPYGFSPTEMDWINSNLALARGICIAWGVPPQLIGIPDVSTYSNYQEARTAFYEDTVMFYLQLLSSSFNAWLFKANDFVLEYLLDDVPAMQYKRAMRWERAQSSTFLEINEKRKLVGYDEKDYGDVLLVPAGMVPIEAVVAGDSSGSDSGKDSQKLALARSMREAGFTEEEITEFLEASL